MTAIVLNVFAILISLFEVCLTEEKGRIVFFAVLVLLNSGLLGYNICKVINGIE